MSYRASVTSRVVSLLEGRDRSAELLSVVELGVNHEEQHQELLLTDIKHLFASNPLLPRYHEAREKAASDAPPFGFRFFDARLCTIGAVDERTGFCFDNETPAHREFVEAHALADRPTTNGEYLEFVREGGYRRPELWLSDGFRVAAERNWTAPLYWQPGNERVFTLGGLAPLRLSDPVCHVSFYEADAFARWSGSRLPTEAEWESAARDAPVEGNLLESGLFDPSAPIAQGHGIRQLYGDVWEWTQSAYSAYPGFRPLSGALGEYNGKFMANQFVLRGGSCATPKEHVRATYRNFFPPDARWQFTGIRLARSA
jgi:ergothioneine biosynthesis protein EgtB